jgi:hypothetical protein
MIIRQYVAKIAEKYLSGITSNQLYREDLKLLIEGCAPDVSLIELQAESAFPSPDCMITKQNVPFGYLLIFPIDKPLDSQGDQKALDLLKSSLANLMLTNRLEFHLYRDGIFVSSASIAEVMNGKVKTRPGEHPSLETLIKAFSSYHRVAIHDAFKLSRTLARKAQLLAAVIERSIMQDEEKQLNQDDKPFKITIKERFTDISIVLKHDVTAKKLADIYAQTISFGMFAARLFGDPAQEEFSRQNIYAFIPSSYSILKKLFQYLAGEDLDDRLTWVINELAVLFRTMDLVLFIESLSESAQQSHPVIQFYKDFLDEYNPKLLKERGELIAHEPLVRFMIQAVDNGRSFIQSGSTDNDF